MAKALNITKKTDTTISVKKALFSDGEIIADGEIVEFTVLLKKIFKDGDTIDITVKKSETAELSDEE